MKIVKKARGRNHWYVDEETGSKVDGVTTTTGNGLPKPALMKWAADATAEFTIDHWDELNKMSPTERLNRIKGGRWEKRDAAAAKGSTIHKLAERLVAGEQVTVPQGVEGYVQSCVDFLNAFDLRAVHVETVVYSETNRHVGTLDLIGDVLLPDLPEFEHIPRTEDGYSRGLFDWKTGKSGIFGDVALQLAPYRWSEWLIQPDGEVVPMPDVDFCAGIHLRQNGYTVVPLETGEDVYRDFLYVREVARIVEGLPSLVGEPIVPPTAGRFELRQVVDAEPAGALF